MRRMFSEKQIQELVKSTKGYNFVNLVDSQGHDRFVEGVLDVKDVTGVTFNFKKWSLSGTHLMIVLTGVIADTTALAGTVLSDVNLPQWILDKLVPLYSNVITTGTQTVYNEDTSGQSLTRYIRKQTSKLEIVATMTASKDRNFRLEFDFLIDND